MQSHFFVLLFSINSKKEDLIPSLYFLANGPQYEAKDDEIKMSKIITPNWELYSWIFKTQYSLDDHKTPINLLA